jgi:hypothetical protein
LPSDLSDPTHPAASYSALLVHTVESWVISGLLDKQPACTNSVTPRIACEHITLANLHTHQMSFRSKPIDPSHAALPTASHARTPCLVGFCDPALRSRALAERILLLRRNQKI